MKEEKGKRKGIPISKAEEMPQGLFIILLSRTFKFMKKKLLLAGATLLLAAAAVTGFAAYEKSSMSELMNANVEALADNEGGETVKCYCKTRVTRPNVCTVQGSGGYCGGDPCSNHDGNCR